MTETMTDTMMRTALVYGVIVGCALLFGCVGTPADESRETYAADAPMANEAALGTASLSDNAMYFTFRRDRRRCIWPLCGGMYLSAVNRAETPCRAVDGRRGLVDACYVGELDFSELGFDTTQAEAIRHSDRPVVVRGTFRRDRHGQRDYVKLLVSEVWQAPTERQPEGRFFRVSDNGRRCITSPCFSWDEDALNYAFTREISGIFFEAAGARPYDVARAYDALAEGGVLAAGMNYPVSVDDLSLGIDLDVVQFYLPVHAETLH